VLYQRIRTPSLQMTGVSRHLIAAPGRQISGSFISEKVP
jgi:hypothetical protein